MIVEIFFIFYFFCFFIVPFISSNWLVVQLIALYVFSLKLKMYWNSIFTNFILDAVTLFTLHLKHPNAIFFQLFSRFCFLFIALVERSGNKPVYQGNTDKTANTERF